VDPAPLPNDRQRIDKWLWHARMVRTRSDAAALAESGHVRLNGRRVTAASQKVAIGDVVTLALDRSVRLVRVEGVCEKRGAAAAARALYCNVETGSGTKASGAKASPT
jgi:ribosome-associated heat shock protein Hsp15